MRASELKQINYNLNVSLEDFDRRAVCLNDKSIGSGINAFKIERQELNGQTKRKEEKVHFFVAFLLIYLHTHKIKVNYALAICLSGK